MKNNQPGPVLIMAGGTGGHVMPALAVALQLKAKGIAVHWLGTKSGIEAKIIPNHNIPMSFITIKGLRGKGLKGWLVAPFRIVRALWQSLKIIYQLKPRVVLSMGGYVAGPGGIAAWLLRCPLVLHEQNAISGLTNRLLSPFAKTIMTAFPEAFSQNTKIKLKVKQTGNPLREAFIKHSQIQYTQKQASKLKVLVVGGSLGASTFNQVVPKALSHMSENNRPEIWHQAGAKHIQEAKDNYQQYNIVAKIEPFIEDMAAAYQWADLIICRAGALTIAEVAACGRPSILVPFPHAVSDHQTANARYLADNGAAILLPQAELTEQKLVEYLNHFLSAPNQLVVMGEKARKLANIEATEQVVNYCMAASQN